MAALSLARIARNLPNHAINEGGVIAKNQRNRVYLGPTILSSRSTGTRPIRIVLLVSQCNIAALRLHNIPLSLSLVKSPVVSKKLGAVGEIAYLGCRRRRAQSPRRLSDWARRDNCRPQCHWSILPMANRCLGRVGAIIRPNTVAPALQGQRLMGRRNPFEALGRTPHCSYCPSLMQSFHRPPRGGVCAY